MRFNTIRLKLFLPLYLLLSFSLPVNAESDKSFIPEITRISIAYHMKTLIEVGVRDSEAALGVWAKELGEKEGLKVETHVYTDLKLLVKDFQEGKIDFASTSTLDYLSIKDDINSEVAFGPVRGGKHAFTYLLLVNTDSTIHTITDLKEKTIKVLQVDDAAILFLNTLLLRSNLQESDEFFSSIESEQKYSQVILPVFFGKADACITTKRAFDLMAELNPQVGKKLKNLAVTPANSFVTSLSFFRSDCDAIVKKKTVKSILSLKEHASGRQLLMLFKVDDVAPMDESELNSMKALVNEYEDLKLDYLLTNSQNSTPIP